MKTAKRTLTCYSPADWQNAEVLEEIVSDVMLGICITRADCEDNMYSDTEAKPIRRRVTIIVETASAAQKAKAK